MKVKTKHIQLFTKGRDNCEVSGRLVSIVQRNGWTTVCYFDNEDDKTIWENRFPDWNVSMIRISSND